MSDIDPDIQAAFGGQESGASASGNIDPEIASAFQGNHSLKHPISPQGVGVGAAENVLSGITSGAGSLADALALGRKFPFIGTGSSDPGSHDITYRPRTEAGQEIAGVIGKAGKKVGSLYDTALGTGPLATTLKERIPEAMGAVGTITGAAGLARGALAGEVESSAVAGSPQSISAAAATPNMAAASSELRAAAQAVKQEGGTVNPEVMTRHIESESLPVPVKLTKGQATQDPALISTEMNERARNPAFAEHFNEQNQALIGNLQHLREEVGPDVFSTNPVEHGETLIQAYKDKAAAANKDISAKYQALENANGGEFPVDAKGLYNNVTQALHKQYLFEHAPSAELRQLANASEEGMTFEKYEAMRTNLARIMRSSSDGNEVAAARTMRSEMEKLPLTGDAASLKPLADSARLAARNQFQALDADPAYAAAVNGKVSPDRFVNRFIVNGDKDKVAMMKQNLADNPAASQTMGVAALDHLRRSAAIDDQFRGNFAQASFNKNLQALSPKMSALFDPQQTQTLSTLGDVARNAGFHPKGSSVNYSNSTTAALKEKGVNILHGVADAKTAGMWSAIGRPILKGRAARKLAEEHLTPGAGLDYPVTTP